MPLMILLLESYSEMHNTLGKINESKGHVDS